MENRLVKQQRIWKWEIAVDIFLAGLGGGSFIFGIIVGWLGYFPDVPRAVLLWGFLPVAMGASLLILDLGYKFRVLNTLLNPRSSWLSRGFLILSAFMLIGFVIWLLSLLPLLGVNIDLSFMPALDIIGVIFGLGAALYTGALLRSVKSIALWNTKLLPVAFMFSAFTTGLMVVILDILIFELAVSGRRYQSGEMGVLVAIGLGLIVIERIMIWIFLRHQYGEGGQARDSVRLLLSGKLSKIFWGGVMGAGLAAAAIFAVLYYIFPGVPVFLILMALCALAGCFSLRVTVVYGGIKSLTPPQKYIEMQYYLITKGRGIGEMFAEAFTGDEDY